MSVIKCKMCGGDLELVEGSSVAVCEYCGSQQTVPAADNEKKLTLFARANRLRLACEFDKAAGVYESIVADFPTEAEAYWGLVLCRYGIEYVDDPATGKKIPTCHRSSFDSVMEDSDFEQALENADAVARRVYRDEAKAIEELRRGIVEVSGKEPPYDIFICYKETAEDGQRTVDSVIAQDVYDALTEKGYRVFFSRISLEDKLGTEYEPYIFAALHSAKIMLAFGTDYEYYNAVWVKNEWSRFLQLMTKDKSKHLIPCYKGIDAYDMPKEFAKLQAQDMGKVGAMQDLLRGVDKIMGKGAGAAPTADTAASPAPTVNPTVTSLLERAEMFLADGDWDNADAYCERTLDIEPKNGTAYLYKLMAGMRVPQKDRLARWGEPFDTHPLYKKALEYASDEQAAFLQECNNAIRYRNAGKMMKKTKTVEDCQKAAAAFAEISGYKDAEDCVRKAEEKAKGKEEDRKERSHLLESKRAAIAPYQKMLALTDYFTVGLRSDGKVVSAGDSTYAFSFHDVPYWHDIVAISAGYGSGTIERHIIGLKADGTVVADGYNRNGQCNVYDWRNIIAIAAGQTFTAGLKSNGRVVATDDDLDIRTWRDIAAIAAGSFHIVGLKSDGTVVATGELKYNSNGECNVSDWHDIVAIAAGDQYTVGLTAYGTVVATCRDFVNTKGWHDIVAIAANKRGKCNVMVGLKSDGTVVSTSDSYDVSDWRDIVAIAAATTVYEDWDPKGGWQKLGAYVYTSGGRIIGLKADGTVVAVGDNKTGQCNVSDWKLIYTEEELATLKKEKAEKRASLTSEKETLQNELSNLKGLFTGKRRKEIESRLAEIDAELKKL